MTSCKISALAIVMACGVAASASAQTWQPGPSLPDDGTGRQYAVGLNDGTQVIALGGSPYANGGDMDPSVQTLTPGSGTWTQRAGFNGVGPFLRTGGAIDSLGRIIVFGGVHAIDPQEQPGDPFVYDVVEGAWFSIAPQLAGGANIGMAVANDSAGRVYAIGGGPGENATGASPNTGFAQRYIANSNQWEAIAPMITPVADGAGVDDGAGHILVIGGVNADGSARLSNVASFDVALGTWSDTNIPDLPVALSGAAAVRGIDDRIYVIGGWSGPVGSPTTVDTTWILNAQHTQWTPGPTLTTARAFAGGVLGPDNLIYALGGLTAAGGTSSVETLATIPCPGFAVQPTGQQTWDGVSIELATQVTGGGTIDLQWMHDGQPVADGTAPSGATFSGAQTDTLLVVGSTPAESGAYTLQATNSCGTTMSDTATVSIVMPPALPTRWAAIKLHPPGSNGSIATGIDQGRVVGVSNVFDTTYGGNLDHPVVWPAGVTTPIDLTPPGSVGGAVSSIGGDLLVGWWWWPYQCRISGQWFTCYSRQGARWTWNGSSYSFTNMQIGGWEYSAMGDTDGVRIVGGATNDDASGNVWSHAFVIDSPNFFPQDLNFWGGAPNGGSSGAAAVDGDNIWGTRTTPPPGGSVHAAGWVGPNQDFVDLHPGGSRSWVYGAGDGLQVGQAITSDDKFHAAMWNGSASTFVRLSPSIMPVTTVGSDAYDTEGGLQVGFSKLGSTPDHALLWSSRPDRYVDLHEASGMDAQYLGSHARALEIAPDGTITVVGYAIDPNNYHDEAFMWVSLPDCPADLTGSADPNSPAYGVPDGLADANDFFYYLDRFAAGDLGKADLTGSADPNNPAYGVPDGTLDASDFFFYLALFAQGC